MRYAYISQRGYYPDDADKANQDAYSADTRFDGDKDKALFMVFDGHGKEGDKCAIFCKDHLPPAVAKCLRGASGGNSVEAALVKAFVETNEQLHADAMVDDSLSGTTAVGVYFHGRDMWVANVGDSRAIVCQEHEGRLVAKPLSSDQTPYRKDERERVKACGARVMSMDQIEGLEPIHENWGDVNLGEELDEGGDPPRIWSPFGEYPGTAFTRSMGDVIAEELGVYAEPEVIHRRLQAGDKFVVVASDGVFEFLTNQSVADMVLRYTDPLDACKKVVQEAYDLWLQYEVRTDDITIICIYLEGLPADGDDDRMGSNGAVSGALDLTNITVEQGLRPVRREMSRQRQRQFIMHNEAQVFSPPASPRAKEKAEDSTYVVEEHITRKSDAEAARILSAIKNNFLFDHITDEQRQVLLDVMVRVEVKAGDTVIRQGDNGDRFYIIDSGLFEVRVTQESEGRRHKSRESAASNASRASASGGGGLGDIAAAALSDRPLDFDRDLGPVVHVYEPTDTLKPCFGHLALLYSKPRSASVVARSDGVLWALDRPVFRRIIVKKNRREVAKTLRRVEVLKSLNLIQLQQLCDVLTDVEFGPGESIIQQGEVGDTFYVIDEGVAVVTRLDPESGTQQHIRRLHEYSYFGERALLLSEPRSANVTADTKVRCLAISQKAFEQVLGPLQHIIDADRKRREQRPGVPPIGDLKLLGVVNEDDLGQMNLVKMPANSATYTLRTMWKTDISKLKQRASVLKAADLLKHATESPVVRMNSVTVPLLMGTYNQPNSVHLVQQVAVVCNLSQLLSEKGVLPMECVRHVASCVVLGLETLHKANLLYRALSPELVCLDSRGYAVLMEFRLAKLGLEGSTLCGTPEYLAPEQVHNQGHGRAVDFWALGVLIYELMHGASPFAAPSEIDIYSKITAHRAGRKSYPSSFAPALCDFLDRLLQPDPAERLGAKAGDLAVLKTHQWFAGFDWAGVARGEYFNQELRQVAHDKIQRAARVEGTLETGRKPYSGDQSHWERF